MINPKYRNSIDVRRFVQEMESDLRNHWSKELDARALAVLTRWQFDDQIDADSRHRARQLVEEYRSWAAPRP